LRTYEALYILSPELDESAIQTIAADVEGMISNNGGTIVRSDVWGKRKLAYTINKHVEGVYIVLRFEANPEFIKRLEQQLRLMEPVIRYLVLYLDAQTLKLEAEQQKQYEEALQASAARRSRGEDDDDDDDEGDERIPTPRRRIVDEDDEKLPLDDDEDDEDE
jgi:small subunit ribosomal protein S6